jgi:acetyltransferase-like isoleucine patch superfamily enzyme
MLIIIKIISRISHYLMGVVNYLINYYLFKLERVRINSKWKVNGRLYISNGGEISIGENFKANSGENENPIGGDSKLRLIVENGGEIKIGSNVGISNSTIYCCTNISVGNYVYIGGGCRIWDTNFHSIDPIERRHRGDKLVESKPIVIEDYVFIGAGSIVLKGIRIGKNSVVGAGSVVTKVIPENEIWAGNPAKCIRKLNLVQGQDNRKENV